MDAVYSCAREIMVAKITEDDIMAGKLMTDGSRLKQVATRLGKYVDEDKNPFGELDRLSVDELIGRLMEKPNAELIPFLFAHYQIGCLNMHRIDCAKMDALVEKLENGTADREKTVTALVELFLSAKGEETEIHPMVERIKKVIADRFTEETTVEQIAETVGISRYYMCHIFKRETGLTPQEYRKELRMKKAKELLVGSDKTVSEIAAAVGFFDASYFAKTFARDETVTPMQYRKLLKKGEIRDKDAAYYSMIPHIDLLAEDFTAPTEKAAVPTYTVSLPNEEYGFLHESAIMAFRGKLFAAWYNCPKTELANETPIRFATSSDGGKTWSEPRVVATDATGKILYCPPIFHVEDGKLYMMLNQMVAPDHMHSLDLYLYEEEQNAFRKLWSRPIPFKLNTNVYAMDNGKLILPGRLGELDKFPTTPAAMISDSGKIDAEWRVVPVQKDGILADGSKLVFPEMSFIVRKGEILSFCRDDPHKSVPLVYKSEDYGESWTGPYSHDIPLIDTKIYSGTLSDGRHYVIGNVGVPRTKLMIYFSEKDNLRFTKSLLLQDGFSKELRYGNWWHY
ncbi:MAG: helix-turn-helix domain-containing protein, partial [Clostridia bacterium]|nr:helix-turn-helix domain-containing protein [Clostridia bacterium]